MTDRNKILWPKPNRNRISATILLSAETETETLKKLKLMFLCVMKRLLINYKLEKHRVKVGETPYEERCHTPTNSVWEKEKSIFLTVRDSSRTLP